MFENEYGLDFDFEADTVQEAYNPGSSKFKDLFDSAFNSFDPEGIIAGPKPGRFM